jgi:hydrogenase maturation protease
LEGGTAGLGLIGLMEGYPRVIIVDAMEMGQPPGHVARFTPQQARLGLAQAPLSPHQLGMGEVLALAQTLGIGLPELVFVGVQPGQVETREGLSQDVEDAVPYAVRTILQELNPTHNTTCHNEEEGKHGQ